MSTDQTVNLKVEVLTPTHIGNGISLDLGADFVSEESRIGIIDEEKVFQLMGSDGAALQKFVAAIERSNRSRQDKKAGNHISELIKTYKSGAKLEDYCSRVLSIRGGKVMNTLKECIRTPEGIPYIPGSSLKGAIRTAILSDIIRDELPDENKIKWSKSKFACSSIEDDIFGKIQCDMFRFIHITDCHFEDQKISDLLHVRPMALLNIRESVDTLLDTAKAPVMLEAISAKAMGYCRLSIKAKTNEFCSEKDSSVKVLDERLKNVQVLFKSLNNHLQKGLEEEMDFWDEKIKKHGWTGGNLYLNEIDEILDLLDDEIDDSKSCILRIGQAIGWRFTTGGWSLKYNDQSTIDRIEKEVRSDRYAGCPFPKSRRVGLNGVNSIPFGFIRLTIVESEDQG